jgi:hypothetical protein
MLEINEETHVGLYVTCPLLLSDFNKSWTVSTNFIKTPNIKQGTCSIVGEVLCYKPEGLCSILDEVVGFFS